MVTVTGRTASFAQVILVAGLCVLLASASFAKSAVLEAFEGAYAGSAEVTSSDGTKRMRDMSVEITVTREGFNVAWSTTSYRADGSANEKSYEVEFVPSERDGVYSAAMERNVFGHEVQLDPMQGEPFVWARIQNGTMTVFSLFVDDAGGYEIQQFDRTLTDGGLTLDFQAVRNGERTRTITTFLEKQ
ncbi:MAG: hypothetical protein WAO69_03755 [Aestuariivita sp.]|uniref:hypothetical protein n=1 Tax=Aestuariivita sp. TaxID=1872407 RepID=UPI003BB1A799